MTVCGNKLSGVCGACTLVNICRNNEIAKLPKSNIEWMREASLDELAEVLNKIFMTRTFCHICPEGGVCDLGYECKYHGGEICDFMEWLKVTHRG